jgi:hypothetical protein
MAGEVTKKPVIPGLREAQNPDCAGRDAGANIREANGPQGALQDAARISSSMARLGKSWPQTAPAFPAFPPSMAVRFRIAAYAASGMTSLLGSSGLADVKPE